ncbi:MAG TPA: tetratricopeptide repeat protein, partial [Polyangiaceae bacterium]
MAEFGDDSDNLERGPRSRRSSFAPPTSTRPRSGDSEAPSERFHGEDFLFHLYRGSELLQDNCISEAKEELERALRMQPQDIEGQGLLGVVYFRLGLYPRAIELYTEVIRACPAEVSPKVNLGLCFLKTGQAAQARDILEEVIQQVPDHVRAWGYLGLALERLGEFERAGSAFERAGQEPLARRMRRNLEERSESERPDSDPPERAEVRRAAADAVQELDGSESGFSRAHAEVESGAPSRSGRWRAVEPGEEAVPRSLKSRRPSLVGRLGPAVPPIPEPDELSRPSRPPGPVSEAAPALGIQGPVAGEPIAESRTAKLLRVKEAVFVRGDAVRALLAENAAFTSSPVMRRMRGRDLEEPLGGPGAPWQLLEGDGSVLIGAAHDR